MNVSNLKNVYLKLEHILFTNIRGSYFCHLDLLYL